MKSNAEWPTRMGGVTIDIFDLYAIPFILVKGFYFLKLWTRGCPRESRKCSAVMRMYIIEPVNHLVYRWFF